MIHLRIIAWVIGVPILLAPTACGGGEGVGGADPWATLKSNALPGFVGIR